MSTLLLCVRAAMLAVSFVGLCAALSVRFQLDRCVAPFVAVSGIIVVLMLAGMAGVLFPAVCALYALGFAGAIYALAKRHVLPRSLAFPLLALAAFLAFLVWRFYFCPLSQVDDLSHWGLVARHLLRHDRFPRSGDDYVFFQNYPLGTACFIYYVGRFTENTEGVYLVAQNFLLGMLYAPMFSLIRKRKGALLPISAALFFLLFHYFRYMIYLQVDIVLGFFGIGTAAAIARYRSDPNRALLSALPAMIAVTFVKNSGLFFSILSAVMFLRFVRRDNARRRAIPVALFAAPIAAFLLWELHIKLRFPAAFSTKHAVSLSAYASQFSSKGLHVIAEIASRQFLAFFKIRNEKVIALLLLLPFSVLLMYATHGLPKPRKRRFRLYFAQAIAIYLVWYLLIFLMYVFSMPQSEALNLASLYRYNGTGLTYLIGLTAILLFELYQDENLLPRLVRLASCLSPLFIAAVILLTALPVGARINKMFDRDTRLSPFRALLQQLRQECGIEDGDRLLCYWPNGLHGSDSASFGYYSIKYEYETDDILMITSDNRYPGLYCVGGNRANLPEEGADNSEDDLARYLDDLDHGSHAFVVLSDVSEFVASELDRSDAFLILGDDPDFEAKIAPALEASDADTPVYRAHLKSLS